MNNDNFSPQKLKNKFHSNYQFHTTPITPRSTLIWSGSTVRVPSRGQVDLFDDNTYLIELCAKNS